MTKSRNIKADSKMSKAHLMRVYREAAELVANDNEAFSCLAIKTAIPGRGRYRTLPEVQLYEDVFEFENIKRICLVSPCYTSRRDFRVLLLLLMAEWVRTDWEG